MYCTKVHSTVRYQRAQQRYSSVQTPLNCTELYFANTGSGVAASGSGCQICLWAWRSLRIIGEGRSCFGGVGGRRSVFGGEGFFLGGEGSLVSRGASFFGIAGSLFVLCVARKCRYTLYCGSTAYPSYPRINERLNTHYPNRQP
jgi:hypothetical protein